MVPEIKKYDKVFRGTIKKIACLSMQFTICMSLLLVVHADVYAQYRIAESRFMTGSGSFSQTCSIGGGSSASDCMPDVNGVVHMRFDPTRVGIGDNGTPNDTSDDRFEFVVQVRKTGGALPYSIGGLGIEYNTVAFGENLNTPAFHNNGDGTATGSGQCTYTRGSGFINGNYGLVIVDTSPSLLSLFEIADGFTSEIATADSFATINDEWQDLIGFSCRIIDADNNGSMNADAGLAFSDRLWAENQVWIAGDGVTSTLNRTVFGVADNDLRGFRLDGKTWVEDYARHDRGRGVRLKFSKGVAVYDDGDSTTPRQLTESNFMILDSDGVTRLDIDGEENRQINIVVEHTVGDDYVNLSFSSAVNRGVLRLLSDTSTGTGIVRDTDDVELANGNFAAALVHDADAPYATGIERTDYTYDSDTEIGMSTWELSFNKPLNPATVIKENFCLTAENGNCESSSLSASIVSVSLNTTHRTTLNIVINEGRIKRAPPPLSLEFKRNAVLGADLKIIEDYQTALRNKIELTDSIPPVITLTKIGDAMPDIDNPRRYTGQFSVTADEAGIDGIDDASLYKILRKPIGSDEFVEISSTLTLISRNPITLQYEVELASLDVVRQTEGFTLARGDNVRHLVDDDNNTPVNTIGTTIGTGEPIDPGVISARSITDAPTFTVRAIDLQIDVDPRPSFVSIYEYEAVPDLITPNSYGMEFAVRANREVLGIADSSSYRVIAKPIDENLPVSASSITHVILRTSETELSRNGDATTLTYTVTLDSVETVRRIRGFTLARGTNANFVDIYGNAPAVDIGDELDTAAEAIARRDTQAPTISLSIDPNFKPTITTSNNRGIVNGYGIWFRLEADELLDNTVIRPQSWRLLRKLAGGGYAIVPNPNEFSITGEASSYTVFTNIRLSEAEARETVGFTLGNNGGVRDLAYNIPITIGADRLFDDSDEALVETNRTHPSIGVVAQGVMPDENDPLVYRGTFEVTANTTVDDGLSGSNGILGLGDDASYWLWHIPSDGSAPSTRTARIAVDAVSDASATISFSTRFERSDEVMETMGFTLARRDNLLDFVSNYPVDPVNTEDEIERGERLDSRDEAVAVRDTESPSYTVAREGDLEIAVSGYTMAFRVAAPSDVPATQFSDLRQSGSYSLLRKLQGRDTYEPMSGRLAEEITVVTTRTVIVRYTDISRLSIDEALNTEGFTLGRSADDRLRDLASNDPVVSIGGTTPTEVTTTPPLPLDANAQALFAIERESPSLTVVPNGAIIKSGTAYRGSFNVTAGEGIEGIESSDSYVLLRAPQRTNSEDPPGTPVVVLAGAQIDIGSVDLTTLQSATISFNVNDPDVDAATTQVYTLGRIDSLTDLVGNPLVDPVTSEAVTINSRIDSRATAEATIPATDTGAPIITVDADGNAVADVGNPLVYRGTFTVTANEDVLGIGYADSYNLLRIARDGEHTITTMTVIQVNEATTADVLGSTATVMFSTTLTVVSLEQTYGFTLGRRDNLKNSSNISAVVDAERRDRLDISGDAVALVDRPLQITAEAITDINHYLSRLIPFNQPDGPKAYPKVNDANDTDVNGNRYSMLFEVRSLNGTAIPGIGSTSSYVLLHVPTDDNEVINLADYIVANSVEMVSFDQTRARVRYTVEFGADTADAAVSLTQRTAGFVLGRATGKLQDDAQPLDSDGNPIADNARINPNPAAIAARDTQSPTVVVDGNLVVGQNGFRVNFNARTESGESLKPQWQQFESHNIFRKLNTGAYSSIARVNTFLSLITLISNNLSVGTSSPFRLSENETRDTVGFTLGYSGASTLRDLSNNDVYQGGTTTQTITTDQPFDIRDDAVTFRDTNPPFIEVTGGLAGDVLDGAQLVFTMTAKTLVDDKEVDALVHGLGTRSALDGSTNLQGPYQLLRILEDGSFEPHNEFSRSIIIESISTTQARITYQDVNLTIAEEQETFGFALGRRAHDANNPNDCPLCDYSGNAPVAVGTTKTVANNEPLDPRESAEIRVSDKMSPTITLRARGEARPDERNPYIYTGQFDVRSSEFIINNIDGGGRLHEPTSYILLRVPLEEDGSAGVPVAIDGIGGTTATLSALPAADYQIHNPNANPFVYLAISRSFRSRELMVTVDFGVELAPEVARQTYGFILGRAPIINASRDDCILCDILSNPPRNPNGDVIAYGDPLNTTVTAIVRRDIVSPHFTVTPIDSLDIRPDGYTMKFRVDPPADVSSTTASEARRSSSYRLLRKLGDNSYLPVSASQQAISAGGNIELSYTVPPLSIEQISETESFTLGLAIAGRLRDNSGNDPVMSVGGAPVTVDPPSPLDDSVIAHLAVERTSPAITVTANSLSKNGNNYIGSFDVTALEGIDGIESSTSYVLLRVLSGEQDVVLSDASISVGSADFNNLRSATIQFNVEDSVATNAHSFTLGRKAGLTDLAGNPPVDFADTGNPIDINERIDSRTSAASAVPNVDTDNPIITVEAIGKATPRVNDRLVYEGGFDVSSDKSVTGLDDQASYKLLRLTTDGATTEVAVTITVNSVSELQVSVAFATTLTALAEVNETIGFTLGRRANLTDASNNPPQLGSEGRLDVSADAIAEVDKLLQITAEAVIDESADIFNQAPFYSGVPDPKAYPEANLSTGFLNGNQYSMIFEVRSLNGEVVPDIASTSSYVLLHVPTTEDNAIDLSEYITAHTVETITTDTHVRVKYTVSFGAADDEEATVNLTQRTAGFVLGRAAGKLENDALPLNGEGDSIEDGMRINPQSSAIAARNTVMPEIEVYPDPTEAFAGVNGFNMSFNLVMQNGVFSIRDIGLLRSLNTNPVSYSEPTEVNYNPLYPIGEDLDVMISSLRLSENEARETVGFTVGYNGSSVLFRGPSNNNVLRQDTEDIGSTIAQGQPLNIIPTALVTIADKNPPFIEVTASPVNVVTVRSDTIAYDITFDVAAKQWDGGLKVDATDVRGLDSATSYQLLRVLEDGGLVAVQNVQNSSATSVSTTRATVYFGNVQVPVSEIENITGFTLTRALSDPDDPNGCPLCDYASNAPFVAGTTETIVGTLTTPTDGFKPLDRGDAAVATIDMADAVSAPTLMVTASEATPNPDNGDEYTMNFVVQSDQPISGNLGILTSYRLVHKPTTGTALVLNNFIRASSLIINDDNDEATLGYTIRFNNTERQTQRTAGFALAANEGLSDMLGNLAMNRQGEAIGMGAEIDTTSTAIARRDTVPPAIIVTADGGAIRDDINTNRYRMRFTVTVAGGEQVRGIDNSDSYTLLQILETGSPQLIVSTATLTPIDSGVTIAYDNIEISENSLNPTLGFTLGRAGTGLRDLANNDPVDANPENSMEIIDDNREQLDSRLDAIAGLVRGMLLRVKLFLEGPFR